ncbi:MAG: DUF3810 domain-containing protein [Acidobacteriota bacterium]|nr:DUF3810 domain-containing protein [Blastocatellia bacterium]MDW8413298.1 DUF3810 domain-containing protein [Acidobacteriota bacterium]
MDIQSVSSNQQCRTTKTSPRASSRLLISSLLLALGLVFQRASFYFPEQVENYYSRTFYPTLVKALSTVTAAADFSVAETCVPLLIIACIFYLAWLRQKSLAEGRLKAIRQLMLDALTASGLICWSFLLLWGINYARLPVTFSLGLQKSDIVDKDVLQQVTLRMINAVNDSHTLAIQKGYDLKRCINSIEQAYARLPVPAAAQKLAPPKAAFSSKLLSHLGISGVYIPFTAEPLFNIAQPIAEQPFTIAHEKAHQFGFALEDEANFLAYLACTQSDDAHTRYSGYLLATSYLLSALARTVPEAYASTFAQLTEGPRSDLEDIYFFWKKHHGISSEISSHIYDTYLRANMVKSGAANYDEVVLLIVAHETKR